MDLKTRSSRRGFFGKGIAAAMVLGCLAAPASSLAKANLPRTKRDPSREYFMKVFYDANGRAYKVCYYDQNGTQIYCDQL